MNRYVYNPVGPWLVPASGSNYHSDTNVSSLWNFMSYLPEGGSTVTSGQGVTGYEGYIFGSPQAQKTFDLTTGTWVCPVTGWWFVGFFVSISYGNPTNSESVLGATLQGEMLGVSGINNLTQNTQLMGSIMGASVGSQVGVNTGSDGSVFVAYYLGNGVIPQ